MVHGINIHGTTDWIIRLENSFELNMIDLNWIRLGIV